MGNRAICWGGAVMENVIVEIRTETSLKDGGS